LRNRYLAASLLTGVAVATLAACGSTDDSSGSSTTPANGSSIGPGAGAGGGAMSAYIQCLRQNGVTLSGPGGGAAPSGAPSGAVPSGASGGGNGGPGGNGTPPSGASGGNGGTRTISKPDGVSDTVWTKAQAACSSLVPSATATATATS
jgi:hypothetical protein